MTTKEQHKAWREANKDKIKGYYLKNKKKNLERAKKNYLLRKKDKIAYQKKWAENNKDKVKGYKSKWKKTRTPSHKFKDMIRLETWKKYGQIEGDCILCGHKAIHRHHTIPYSVDNFILLCLKCHTKIHNTEEEYDKYAHKVK